MQTTRRALLGWAGTTGAAAAAGAFAGVALSDEPVPAARIGPRTISPYAAHQPGIAEPAAAANRLIALDLLPATDADALGRLMRRWTEDIVALTQGRPAPGETVPDLAAAGVDLTITVGWGHGLFTRIGIPQARPDGLRQVPPMKHDRLEERWSGGDLLLIIGAADDTSVAHASRRMLLDAKPFAWPRWEQWGSWRGRDEQGRPVTGRNLFGQVDGTGNPAVTDPAFAKAVWATAPDWFAGGTTVVVRRIEMDLDSWDELTRNEQERAIGRTLDTGAPLGGKAESEPLDLTARDENGDLAIPFGAHARLAHPDSNGGARIYRKGINYVEPGPAGSSGLIFLSHQADIARQFTPMQQRLDVADDLNTWTTAIGSAEFALLPGFTEGHWLGESLLG